MTPLQVYLNHHISELNDLSADMKALWIKGQWEYGQDENLYNL